MKKILVVVFVFFLSQAAQEKPKLNDFNKIVYSQFGEDGIIEKIFEIIGTRSKTCIEFGAADGFNCSNTANLFVNKGWKAILIEADSSLVPSLRENVAPYDCVAIERKIGTGEHDSVDAILEEHGMGSALIDLISIDIDGDDYYIFDSLKIRPRVVICEHNPTFPNEYDIYTDKGARCGCSVQALNRIANKKGYRLIAVTHCNAFFVVEEEYHKFDGFETSIEKIKVDEAVKYIVTDYSGRYTIIGHPASSSFRKAGFPLNGAKLSHALHGDFLRLPHWTLRS